MTVITIVIGNDGRVQGTCDPPDAPLWPEDANAEFAGNRSALGIFVTP